MSPEIYAFLERSSSVLLLWSAGFTLGAYIFDRLYRDMYVAAR
jgi:hypothetical protein